MAYLTFVLLVIMNADFCLALGFNQATYKETKITNFIHPGIGFNTDDLKRMVANRDVEPWKTGYTILNSTAQGKLGYVMQGPFPIVGREPNLNLNQYQKDSEAVLYQAIQWIITKDSAYADNAIHILNSWTTMHTQWTGGTPFLAATDIGSNLIWGAEILRYTYVNWTAATTINCENYFQRMLWPLFNVNENTVLRAANQGAAQLKGAISVAVFCNNQTKFDQTLKAWYENKCGGFVGTTLPSGQNADSGRDQGHALGLISNFAFVAETAWKQNIDLFGELDNRLLAASEYFTSYNLGNEVPYITFGACYGLYSTMGTYGRGKWNWAPLALEIIRGAYVIRKGLPAPFTVQFLDSTNLNIDTFLYRKDASATVSLTSVDIGDVGLAGSSSYADGIWTVTGAGTDIWGGLNNFHFAYQSITGDTSIVARILDVQNTHLHAKAGLMIRETLSTDSPYATVIMKAETDAAQFYNRGSPGGRTENFQAHDRANILPYWFKLERKGNLITASNSFDAITWTPMRVVVMPMANTVYVGLAVTSYNKSLLNNANFANVVISIK